LFLWSDYNIIRPSDFFSRLILKSGVKKCQERF
jgi:hypothetical protein